MNAYLDLMYALWEQERRKNWAHLGRLARMAPRRLTACELLGDELYALMLADRAAVRAHRASLGEPADRYDRLLADLDDLFLGWYRRALDD